MVKPLNAGSSLLLTNAQKGYNMKMYFLQLFKSTFPVFFENHLDFERNNSTGMGRKSAPRI